VIVPEGNGKWLEYAGGYTDMLAQRGEDVRKAGATPTLPSPARGGGKGGGAVAPTEAKLPRTAAGPLKRKLNFNEKHALETLPGKIASLEAEIARLQTVLADTTLYARDRGVFDRASSAMTEMQSELAAAEERWLELELKRDEIENA
jgi:ABC transport system ATP-binding/permease protein